MEETIIRLDNIAKSFGNVKVIQNIRETLINSCKHFTAIYGKI